MNIWKRQVPRAAAWVCYGMALLPFAVFGLYLYYPQPTSLLESMWSVRTDVWQDLKAGSSSDALDGVRRWESLAGKLFVATLLRKGKVPAETRQRIADLQGRLAALHDALSQNHRERLHALGVACFDAHRRCAAAFQAAPVTIRTASSGGDHHQHSRREIASGERAPTVEMAISPDAMAGWNVQVQTTNFRFAPEHASQPHVPGEGHAHLYIDGEKVARLYGPWYYIRQLAPGLHKVRVTLNGNDHADYVVSGRLVAAETAVAVKDMEQLIYFGTQEKRLIEFKEEELCRGE